MKKKILLASTIVLSLGLMACSPSSENEQVPVEDNVDKDTDDNVKDAEDKLDDAQDDIDKAKDDLDDAEKDDSDRVMTDEEMIEEADYIAKVKIVEAEDGKLKAELIENLKGDILGEDIPNDENFKKDKEYVVFLKDENGKPEPIAKENHYREIKGTDDEILKKIDESSATTN